MSVLHELDTPALPFGSAASPGNAGRVDAPRHDRDALLGTWLDDQFLIEAPLATGGFGAMYRGRTKRGDAVAIKVLHPWLVSDPNMVARFRREGAIAMQLRDPHTVATLAVGLGDAPYIAMELLTGESLHDRLHRVGAVAWPAAVAIARAVCSSLAEAHALGIVHRDVKPANVHLEAGERVKVIDFGIAKLVRGAREWQRGSGDGGVGGGGIDDGRELTYAGHMIGTYDYMSPEQLVGDDCRPASDIYSLGLVMYEMLTGRRPFPDVNGPASMMAALLMDTPELPSRLAAVPAALDRVVMRCLARDPEDRFADMRALAAALDAINDGDADTVMSAPLERDDAIEPPTYNEHTIAWEPPTKSERRPVELERRPAPFTTLPGFAIAPRLASAKSKPHPTPPRSVPALVPRAALCDSCAHGAAMPMTPHGPMARGSSVAIPNDLAAYPTFVAPRRSGRAYWIALLAATSAAIGLGAALALAQAFG